MFPVRENVDIKHHFNEIQEKVESLKSLTGPVFDISRIHSFDVINSNLADFKNLVGPVYSVDHHHCFSDIERNLADLITLIIQFMTLTENMSSPTLKEDWPI